MRTKDAICSGYWAVDEKYFKEWEKYSVVEAKSKLIFMTSNTKTKAEDYINFLNGADFIPNDFQKRMRKSWQ